MRWGLRFRRRFVARAHSGYFGFSSCRQRWLPGYRQRLLLVGYDQQQQQRVLHERYAYRFIGDEQQQDELVFRALCP